MNKQKNNEANQQGPDAPQASENTREQYDGTDPDEDFNFEEKCKKCKNLDIAGIKRAEWLRDNGYTEQEAFELARRRVFNAIAIKASKRTRVDEANGSTADGPAVQYAMTTAIPIRIAPADYPTSSFSRPQWIIIRTAITKRMQQHMNRQKDSEFQPEIGKKVFVGGYCLVLCMDKETVQWLKQVVSRMKLWKSASLKVVSDKALLMIEGSGTVTDSGSDGPHKISIEQHEPPPASANAFHDHLAIRGSYTRAPSPPRWNDQPPAEQYPQEQYAAGDGQGFVNWGIGENSYGANQVVSQPYVNSGNSNDFDHYGTRAAQSSYTADNSGGGGNSGYNTITQYDLNTDSNSHNSFAGRGEDSSDRNGRNLYDNGSSNGANSYGAVEGNQSNPYGLVDSFYDQLNYSVNSENSNDLHQYGTRTSNSNYNSGNSGGYNSAYTQYDQIADGNVYNTSSGRNDDIPGDRNFYTITRPGFF